MRRSNSSSGAMASGSSSSASELGTVYKNTSLPPTRFGASTLCCTIRLGGRKAQEDRCILVPRVCNEEGAMFLGVYDGTVGDAASEAVSHRLAEAVCTTPHFQRALAARSARAPLPAGSLEAALADGFRATDDALLRAMQDALAQPPPANLSAQERMEREKELAYCASTAVAAALVGSTLAVAHIGDSRAALGRRRAEGGAAGAGASAIEASFLTLDHKPNSPAESARIAGAGGSIVYLHGGKPFLRGGDFSAAQAQGRKPMQLNYSRAFGGLRLKPYGLSAAPDVISVELSAAEHTILILGSDGLWDIFSDPGEACRRAWEAHCNGWDASAILADAALAGHESRGTEDNVTCIVLILAPLAAAGAAAGGVGKSSSSGSLSSAGAGGGAAASSGSGAL